MNCLIGFTGFVGGNLAAQRHYDVLINSKNFHSLENRSFDRIVCAGIPAVKWKANKDPEGDLAHINELVEANGVVDHLSAFRTLKELNYRGAVSIEMKMQPPELPNLESALQKITGAIHEAGL